MRDQDCCLEDRHHHLFLFQRLLEERKCQFAVALGEPVNGLDSDRLVSVIGGLERWLVALVHPTCLHVRLSGSKRTDICSKMDPSHCGGSRFASNMAP